MGFSTQVDPHGRTDEECRAIRAKLEEADRIAAANWDNPQWRHEMAQEMTETIYWGFEHENLLQLFSTVENVPFEGRSFIKEVRGLRAFWLARGGYIETSDLKAEVVEILPDMVGFHVSESEDKLRTNFGETQATLVDLGIQRLDAVVNQAAFAMFQQAVPFGHPSYQLMNTGVELPFLNLAVRNVKDASLGGIPTIVGRATMTDQIIDQLMGTGGNTSGFFPETNEQLLRLGVLGVYRGCRIVELKNYKDDVDMPYFPANELWVIGRDASKFAFFGGLFSKESTEDLDWYWHYLARRDFGGIVYRPNRLRRLVDSTIEPTFNSGGSYEPV